MNLSHKTRAPRALALALALLFILLSEPAWAYLDPGTGSMIISAVVGLFATAGLAVKTYWYKIKGFFRRDAQDESTGDDSAAGESTHGESALASKSEQDAEAQRSSET